MDATYAGSYGRIKVHAPDFLEETFMRKLVELPTLDDITKALASTTYREDVDALSAIYTNPELLEMVINRHLIKKNRIAMMAAPPIVSTTLKTYFSKWDIENIKSILTSKLLGYTLKETEVFLLSFRDIPMGIFGGILTHDDYRALLMQGSIESIISYLAVFGYGTYLLQYMDLYRKSGDISILFSALDSYFYKLLLNSLKFYNGDEGPVSRYFKEKIDMRNIMMVIKAKDLEVPWDNFSENLIDLGNIKKVELEELYKMHSIDELVLKLKDMYDLSSGIELYHREGVMYGFEIELSRKIYEKYIKILSMLALSLGSIFSFILTAEREREMLRTIIIGKQYGLDNTRINALLGLEGF